MADVTRSGKPSDERSKQLKLRRLQHEIHALEVSAERSDLSILEAEMNIERMRETITATQETIAVKQTELEALKKGL